jgi:hypothetical protein
VLQHCDLFACIERRDDVVRCISPVGDLGVYWHIPLDWQEPPPGHMLPAQHGRPVLPHRMQCFGLLEAAGPQARVGLWHTPPAQQI